MTAWQSSDHGPLIAHLRELRRKGSIPARRRNAVTGCAACRGIRRTILVDGAQQVVYSEPCLACRGGGATEKAPTSA
ncbi:hypothetical protein [Streptomyces sp. NPDC058674]|uniref:hypothetical protein n=1 Tax=Streptomyces sp. NPDC058674 TaxID=3346592 RepID=UPI0036585BFC